ncbi:GtrA family protein [bacterium]|uniref:GtrA family protein n=1 Tax=Candidatus Scatenecus faecavium TaxID=2840915 RepID=A0A9D1FUM5_9BACT|nr:GtrA family protein [bacterium]HIS82233.1 GtrA family protein [Candidatus Scatenecus faecavium]
MKKLLEIYNFWCKIPDKIRFLIIGAINAGISYVIFAVAVYLIGEQYYQVCAALQWILSSFISFTNQKVFVFCTKGNWIKEYLRCCMTWLVSYLLNALILEVFVKYIDINVYLAQFLAIFTVSVVTYVLFKYFAFRVHKNCP